MRPLLLRLHRWTTLVFALPLAVVILTGLVLSFEPIAQDLAFKPGSLSVEKLTGFLDAQDKDGKARGITVRLYENRLILQGVGPDGSLDLDATSGVIVDDDARMMLSDIFRFARPIHEHFVFDQGWIVTASTIAMLVLALLGVIMGWPRLRNTISGWHQGMAWILLPLVVLSPLTGLALAFGITFIPAAPRERAEPVAIREAVRMLGEKTDLSGLIWLRTRGGRLMARINEGGSFRAYAISKQGVVPAPTNWPRALHEGNFAGLWSGLMVLITSLAFIGLMGTGLLIYFRRLFRKRNVQRERV